MTIGADDQHTGFGLSIAFTTSAAEGSMYIHDVQGPEFSREKIETTHNGLALIGTAPHQTAWPTYIPSAVMDGFEISGTCVFAIEDFAVAATHPCLLAPETITLKFPKRTGDATSGPTVAFTGFFTRWAQSLPMKGQATAEFVLAASGAPTIVAGV